MTNLDICKPIKCVKKVEENYSDEKRLLYYFPIYSHFTLKIWTRLCAKYKTIEYQNKYYL